MGSPYQSQSASGYNASPPPDDGTTVAANKITWAVSKTKLADPLKTLADAINTQLLTALDVSHNTTSINYTTLVSDHLKPIEVTGTTTISLGDASTMTAGTLGYRVYVVNKGVATVTVNLANAANTLDGSVNGTQSVFPGGVGIFSVNQARNGYYSLSGMKGNTWAVPGSIGSTTPNAGAFTALSATGTITASGGTITTGGVTALSLGTSGGTQLKIADTPAATNFVSITGSAGGAVLVGAGGTPTAQLVLQSKGAAELSLYTGGGDISFGAKQVAITHTASADRYGTFTGGVSGSGTNFTIGVSGGSLNLSAATIAAAGLTVSSGQTLTLTGATTLGGIAQNSQSAAYTTVLADGGKHILHPTADNVARTFTIDSNANVAYPIGTTLTFVNEINTVTIAITTDTLLLAGTASTGSRTLAAGGIATALKKGTTSWIISGTGLS